MREIRNKETWRISNKELNFDLWKAMLLHTFTINGEGIRMWNTVEILFLLTCVFNS